MNATAVGARRAYDDVGLTVGLVVVHVVIKVVGWVQTIFSLNRYRGLLHFTVPERFALALCVTAGFTRVIASLATSEESFVLQMWAAGVSSMLVWASFIILYNDSISLPSRQQTQSIGLGLVTTGLWELNSGIIVLLAK